MSPHGVKHYYTKLAIVAFDGAKFKPPQGSGGVNDCRLFFPPLTSVQTQQTPCTLVLTPGTDWVSKIAALFSASPSVDAELCFTEGTFTTGQPVQIATTGNVKVSGAGWGTRLIGSGIEAVLQFNGCASAIVRDLFASADTVDQPPEPAGSKGTPKILGALDFSGCGEVLVENVSLQCGDGLLPGAACLVIRSNATQNVTAGSGVARVHGSTFTVGEMQYGMLLIHQERVYVEDNRITAAQRSSLTWVNKLKSPIFQKQLLHVLVGSAAVFLPKTGTSSSASSSSSSSVAGGPQPGPRLGLGTAVLRGAHLFTTLNTGVSVGGKTVQFNSPAPIAQVFQTYADLNGPKEFATQSDLYTFVQQSALKLVTDPTAAAQFPSFQNFLNGLQRADATTIGTRGIAVGGQAITELRIRNNSIDFMLQGITAGVSHKEKRPPALPANSMQHVTIADNDVTIVLNAVSGYSKARWAIFVGNAANVLIENNNATMSAPPFAKIASDGIRVWGYLGKKMIVRHNHVGGFTRNAFVRALMPTGPKHDQVYWFTTPPAVGSPNANLWLVADNVFDGQGNAIEAPACIVTDNWP